MAVLISVTEYSEDGFAIIKDSVGNYLVTKDSDEIIPLSHVGALLGVKKSPCALLQSRDKMLT